jgi:phage terminase Nu1 subunit (DNA packaging protein)
MTLPKTASTEELSTLLGVNARTLGKLVEKGILKRLKHGTFDLTDSVQAYITYRETIVEEKHETGAMGQAQLELIREKITMLRLEREEKERTLLPAQDVIRWSTKYIGVVKMQLLSLPARLAARLTNVRETSKVELMLRGAITESLTELQQLLKPCAERKE